MSKLQTYRIIQASYRKYIDIEATKVSSTLTHPGNGQLNSHNTDNIRCRARNQYSNQEEISWVHGMSRADILGTSCYSTACYESPKLTISSLPLGPSVNLQISASKFIQIILANLLPQKRLCWLPAGSVPKKVMIVNCWNLLGDHKINENNSPTNRRELSRLWSPSVCNLHSDFGCMWDLASVRQLPTNMYRQQISFKASAWKGFIQIMLKSLWVVPTSSTQSAKKFAELALHSLFSFGRYSLFSPSTCTNIKCAWS